MVHRNNTVAVAIVGFGFHLQVRDSGMLVSLMRIALQLGIVDMSKMTRTD